MTNEASQVSAVPLERAPLQLMASVLSADFGALGDECRELEAAGVDGIQWDVMDGNAVPSLSFGPDVIASCRGYVDFEFEAHVMMREPDPLIGPLADAGCASILIHPDWIQNPWRTVERIKDLNVEVGVALSPGTPLSQIRWFLDVVDLILIMTVEPGYGGQPYVSSMEKKVAEVAALLDNTLRQITIEVDGGIGSDTVASAYKAGARRFVIGSALWRYPSFSDGVADIRSRVNLSGGG